MTALLYEVRGPKSLEEMSWQEVEEARQRTKIVLIPCGAIESHGPHLPLGADTMQANYMCRLMARKLEAEGIHVLVGPSMGFGNNPTMMDFPGTIHFRPGTVQSLLEEICLGLYKHGFTRFAFVMGHGGNTAIQELAAQEVVVNTGGDAKAISLNWLMVINQAYPTILRSKKREGHGGEGETSRVMVHHPNLVMLERAKSHYPPDGPAEQEIPFSRRPAYGGGVAVGAVHFKSVSPFGSVGDPTLASVETGHKLYDVICNWMCAVIKRELAD